MEKANVSCHYVPRLILRKFSDKLCLYNVKTGELQEGIPVSHAYTEPGLYDMKTENALNRKVESQFGNLLSNVLLKGENEIVLTREQLLQLKKFMIVSILRTMQGEEFLAKERQTCAELQFPFEERQIAGETMQDYWMRTLNVVLDTDGTPEGILNHPMKTYPAYRWSQIVCSGYTAFWDSSEGSEFVITDIGMTSENEIGWDGISSHNCKKIDWVHHLYKLPGCADAFAGLLNNIINFSENFMMFPTSSKRMIVLINPFFKWRNFFREKGCEVPALKDLTEIPNEALFEPNGNKYISPQTPGTECNFQKNDKYIYSVKKLSAAETHYCNALFMDRIDTYLGFSSLERIVGSVNEYKKRNSPPFVPRADYTGLYNIVRERYPDRLI